MTDRFTDIFDTSSNDACQEMTSNELREAGIQVILVRPVDDPHVPPYSAGLFRLGHGKLAVFNREQDHWCALLEEMPDHDLGTVLSAPKRAAIELAARSGQELTIDWAISFENDLPWSDSGWEAYWRTMEGESNEGKFARHWCINTKPGLKAFAQLLGYFTPQLLRPDRTNEQERLSSLLKEMGLELVSTEHKKAA